MLELCAHEFVACHLEFASTEYEARLENSWRCSYDGGRSRAVGDCCSIDVFRRCHCVVLATGCVYFFAYARKRLISNAPEEELYKLEGAGQELR